LTGITGGGGGSSNSIVSGTTNLSVVGTNGNIAATVSGVGNVVVWAPTGEYVTGIVSATGNITAGTGNYFVGNGYYLTGITGGGGSSITITDQLTTGTTLYPLFGNTTSGTLTSVNTSSTKLTYVPSTGTLNSVIFNTTSDENKKTNIEIILDALNIVENLRGVTFEFTEGGMLSAGLIAQDVEKYLPQLISENSAGKSLNYNGVIGILVEAVKTLSEKVKNLENK